MMMVSLMLIDRVLVMSMIHVHVHVSSAAGKHISVSRALHMVVEDDDGGAGDGGDDDVNDGIDGFLHLSRRYPCQCPCL